jgi:hypothetical protein
MSPIQRIIVRRMAGQRLADDGRTSLQQAIREIDTVASRATPAMLAAAVGCEEAIVRQGLFVEACAAAFVSRAGLPVAVAAIGDGEFLKWLFSEEGREAMLAFVETIVKIVAILAPLFV